MSYPCRESIKYKGWVTFTDGHTEDIISGFKFGDYCVEVLTATGDRYMCESVNEYFVGDCEGNGIIIHRKYQFSKLDEKGRWLVAENIESFKFDTNIGLGA